jgi:two-component system sensor histidine kinase RegB
MTSTSLPSISTSPTAKAPPDLGLGSGSEGGSDRPQDLEWQGGDDVIDAVTADYEQGRRGLRLRTLMLLRWVSILGQTIAVLWVGLVLKFDIPIVPCLTVIGAAGVMNLSFGLAWSGARLAREREALFQLAFDLIELSLLLVLTGGLSNPFTLLMMAPVVVGAATLPTRHAAALGGLALLIVGAMSLWSAPLPWIVGQPFVLPPLYEQGLGIATAVGIVFTAAYAWQAQAEGQRMELALAATQAVLSREQRLSALGGLAAAAAHELGTPLATIQVVTKEMRRGLEPGTSLYEDVELLISQAERCREILRQLSRQPDASDAHHERMSLTQLMDEVSTPHQGPDILINTEVTCAPGASILEVRRRAEILHGLTAFVENAVDFAESMVEVTAYYDAERLTITVRDDGPGFSADVMAKLGEPYVTTRSHGENSRSGHLGMGLGFFIAKTLLERSGARVEFHNARRGGAVIAARWPRGRIEAAPEV